MVNPDIETVLPLKQNRLSEIKLKSLKEQRELLRSNSNRSPIVTGSFLETQNSFLADLKCLSPVFKRSSKVTVKCFSDRKIDQSLIEKANIAKEMLESSKEKKQNLVYPKGRDLKFQKNIKMYNKVAEKAKNESNKYKEKILKGEVDSLINLLYRKLEKN